METILNLDYGIKKVEDGWLLLFLTKAPEYPRIRHFTLLSDLMRFLDVKVSGEIKEVKSDGRCRKEDL
jgi:hypothetical protein